MNVTVWLIYKKHGESVGRLFSTAGCYFLSGEGWALFPLLHSDPLQSSKTGIDRTQHMNNSAPFSILHLKDWLEGSTHVILTQADQQLNMGGKLPEVFLSNLGCLTFPPFSNWALNLGQVCWHWEASPTGFALSNSWLCFCLIMHLHRS